MTYRTKTYIAAEWDGEKDAIKQLKKWNESELWKLHFLDAHEITQARDTSLNCSIKKSLKKRLDVSKTFVLIVGNNTATARSGHCVYCTYYNSNFMSCNLKYSLDFKSYIEYECSIAIKDIPQIIVLYNSLTVDKNKCPALIRDYGEHVQMKKRVDGKINWDYQSVKDVFYSS